MKKIFLLLTILTTLFIGLVFANPTYAYFVMPTTEFDGYFTDDYYIDEVSPISTASMEFDYWEIELVSLSPYGPGPKTFFQIYDVVDNIGLFSMYVTTDFGYSSLDDGFFTFDIDPRKIEYFNLGDTDSLENYLFDLEGFQSSSIYIYLSTFKDTANYIEVESQIYLFIRSLAYMSGFVQDNVTKIASYQTNMQAYERGHQDGYNKGYQDGYDYGEVVGESNGYILGSSDGYNLGRDDYGFFNTSTNTWITASAYGEIRYTQGLNADFDYFEWMRSALFLPAQILAIEIWPGFQLGYFAFFTLLLGIVGFIFGLFGKGKK